MTKLTLRTVTTLQNSAISLLNDNFSNIIDAVENTLSRDGTQPNEMLADLDMNSNRILNCVDAVSLSEPVTLRQLNDVLITIGSGTGTRIRLVTDTIFYVSPSGNDSNDGRTSLTPFKTIQFAVNFILTKIDSAGYSVTIQLANGTYDLAGDTVGVFQPLYGGGSFTIKGNAASPSSVLVTTTDNYTFFLEDFASVHIRDLKVECLGSGGLACIAAFNFSIARVTNVVFGNAPGSDHIICAGYALVLMLNGPIFITGSANFSWHAAGTGNITCNQPVTLTGTPTFTVFAYCEDTSTISASNGTSFTGSAIGQRHFVDFGSTIFVEGAVAGFGTGTVFPGNTPGVARGQFEGVDGTQGTMTLVNGANNDVVITSGQKCERISGPSAAFSISGFIAPPVSFLWTQELVVQNPTGQSMTIKNLSGSSSSNQIITGTGADVTLSTPSTVSFIYSPTDSKWLMVSGGGGGGGGGGTITGPGSSTDQAIVRWNGITGTVIQDSSVTVSNDLGVGLGGPIFDITHNATGTAGEDIGMIQWHGKNASGTAMIFAREEAISKVVTAGSEEGKYRWSVQINGILSPVLQLERTNLAPTAAGGLNLGASGLGWAKLWIDTNGLIDFGTGNVVITHSNQALTVTDVSNAVTFNQGSNFFNIGNGSFTGTANGFYSGSLVAYDNTGFPILNFLRGRNNSGSPLRPNTGDTMGIIIFRDYTGTFDAAAGAQISAQATENHGATARGTNMSLGVVANTTNSITTRIFIDQDGTLTFSKYGAGILHSSSGGVISSSAVDLTGADVTGQLKAASFPALTGDVTTPGGSLATTLATVNSNVGTFGDATHVGSFTVNGKGLITAASSILITPAASSITGGQALTKTDDTNVILTLGGTPATALLQAVSLTLGWTGTLVVSRGGIGVGTITGIMQGNGTSAVTGIANSSTVGQTLRVTGASTYAWGALDLSNSNAVTGQLVSTSFPALTGDVTTPGGSLATTLATVNATTGTFGSATQVGQFSVNNKGLITSALNVGISLTHTAITDFTSAVQNVIGSALVDTHTLDLLSRILAELRVNNILTQEAFRIKDDVEDLSDDVLSSLSFIKINNIPFEILESDRTYYVSTGGSDLNDGLTSGTPFLTIQKAFDTAAGTLYFNNHSVIILLGNGTFDTGVSLYAWNGGGNVFFVGNGATNTTVTDGFAAFQVFSSLGAGTIAISDLKMTGGFASIYSQANGVNVNYKNVEFGSTSGANIFAVSAGQYIQMTGPVTISGGSPNHIVTTGGAAWACNSSQVTLTGTPNFSDAFVYCQDPSNQFWGGSTFVGTATGSRYHVLANGVVNTNGGGATFLPGDAAGTTATGGQYL